MAFDPRLGRDGVRGQAVVIALVVIPEFRGFPALPPGSMASKPGDGQLHPAAEVDAWSPAERKHPPGIQRIAIVMTRPILDEMLQRLRLAAKLEDSICH